jgi:hypothetical protein
VCVGGRVANFPVSCQPRLKKLPFLEDLFSQLHILYQYKILDMDPFIIKWIWQFVFQSSLKLGFDCLKNKAKRFNLELDLRCYSLPFRECPVCVCGAAVCVCVCVVVIKFPDGSQNLFSSACPRILQYLIIQGRLEKEQCWQRLQV